MSALKAIVYFSVFKYPLTKSEIFSFCSLSDIKILEKELKHLLKNKIIFKHGDYYSDIKDNTIVEQRIIGNEMAQNIMPKALKTGKFIMKFPFIESVCLSGALAKGYYDNDGDIDFFIITKPKYLWLARTFLIIFKKIFKLNSKKYFCVNYFISSNALVIKEQNRFTATELLTLIPLYGKTVFNSFIDANTWATKVLPNKKNNTTFLKSDFKKPLWSRTLESIFSTKMGQQLDTYLKQLTLKKWNSKFKNLNKENFDIAMKSTNDVSKHHPQDFQNKVIVALNKRYKEKNEAFNLNLVLEHA